MITAVLFTVALYKKELSDYFGDNMAGMSGWTVIGGFAVAVTGGASIGSLIMYMDQWYIGAMGAIACLGIILTFKIATFCQAQKNNNVYPDGLLGGAAQPAFNPIGRM